MIKKFIILLFCVSIISCQTRQKFDKVKWAEVADLMTFPNRKLMVEDLTKNFPLKGMTYSEIIELLGPPQGKDDNDLQIFYDIDIDYGVIDPVYTKTLTFQFDKDSTVKTFELKEWKK